jgi:hypothetical protein
LAVRSDFASAPRDALEEASDFFGRLIGSLVMRKMPGTAKDREVEIDEDLAQAVGPGVRNSGSCSAQRTQVGTPIGGSAGFVPFIMAMRPAWDAW